MSDPYQTEMLNLTRVSTIVSSMSLILSLVTSVLTQMPTTHQENRPKFKTIPLQAMQQLAKCNQVLGKAASFEKSNTLNITLMRLDGSKPFRVKTEGRAEYHSGSYQTAENNQVKGLASQIIEVYDFCQCLAQNNTAEILTLEAHADKKPLNNPFTFDGEPFLKLKQSAPFTSSQKNKNLASARAYNFLHYISDPLGIKNKNLRQILQKDIAKGIEKSPNRIITAHIKLGYIPAEYPLQHLQGQYSYDSFLEGVSLRLRHFSYGGRM